MYKLPQIIDFVKNFDSNKTVSFKVIDNNLFKKYAKNLGKILKIILLVKNLILNLFMVIMTNK